MYTMRERDIYDEIIDASAQEPVINGHDAYELLPGLSLHMNKNNVSISAYFTELGEVDREAVSGANEIEGVREDDREQEHDNSEDLIEAYFHSMGDIGHSDA